MSSSAWKGLLTATSTTESERYLAQLAKKVFLSLWSFPNVYTDEGKHGKGNGKELCDLLVVFGNDIILFSDKACKFTPHSDIEIAWSRWFRKAIEKSAKQLSGAESWISRFPNRLFLDPACTSTLPVQLPRLSDCRIHLVAVARGSREYAKKYWGEGGSSSLFINTTLVEDDHKNSPFCIGWSLPNKRLVHVLDETTLDILLNELDTISDFVSYLTKKEEIFCNHALDFIVPGEEELLAFYLSHFDYKKNEHHFPEIPDGAVVALNEGDWQRFINSKSYASRYEANEISYIWDALIEFQNRHIIEGSAESLTGDDSSEVYELVMRIMASENRLARRVLGESFYIANNLDKKGKRYTRTVMSSTKSGRAYIFMALSSPDGCSVSDYRDMRRSELMLYIQGCKLNYKKVDEVLGIVFEPGQKHLSSVDFLYVKFGLDEIDTDFVKEIKRDLKEFNMWQTGAIKLKMIRNLPFPHIESLVLRRILWFMNRLNQTIRNIWNRIQKQE